MATASIVKVYPGTPKRTVTDCTMDTSYLTGGEVFTAEDLGLNNVEYAIANMKNPHTTGAAGPDMASVVALPQTNGGVKVKVYNQTPVEVTSTNSLVAAVIRVTAWGV